MVFDASTNELVLRLIVSVVLGAIVGIERQLTHRPAGLRTHMLVSLGATLFGIIAVTNFTASSASFAAGIVTGIGFIGAGNIIAFGNKVHGLTTAASLWAVAAIGLAIGLGDYTIAIATTFLVFIILQMWRIEKHFK